ncbi:hypothetical protein ACWDCO_34365 [Streptomyces albogriseolus]
MFDLLRLEGIDTTGWLYERRREALERLYAERRLSGTWALCPSTTDQSTVGRLAEQLDPGRH